MLPPIVAVDFDGTLVTDRYPEVGHPNTELIELMKFYRSIGVKVVLWTCRTEGYLDEAIRMCEAHGLTFDSINENIQEVKELYGGDTRKVFADIYIDDKAVSHKYHGTRI